MRLRVQRYRVWLDAKFRALYIFRSYIRQALLNSLGAMYAKSRKPILIWRDWALKS